LDEHNKKAVFGSRFKKLGANINRSAFRHIFGRMVASLIARVIKIPFYDTQCGAKVFHKSIIESIVERPFLSRWLFDVEIILRLKAVFGDSITTQLHEYPLKEWHEVDGSKIKWHY